MTRRFRGALVAGIVFLSSARGEGCSFTIGPDGLCAALRVDPARRELRVGDGFQVRINADGCSSAAGCPCADSAMATARWQSGDTAIARVGAQGMVTAYGPGSTEIVLTGAGGEWQRTRVRVTVVP